MCCMFYMHVNLIVSVLCLLSICETEIDQSITRMLAPHVKRCKKQNCKILKCTFVSICICHTRTDTKIFCEGCFRNTPQDKGDKNAIFDLTIISCFIFD